MQISERDLTATEAKKAAQVVERKNAESAPEEAFQVDNALKTLVGYALRRKALDDIAEHGRHSAQARESTAIFCRWLNEKGFWFD